MYKCILVPTDGSALSRKTAKKAIQLAREQRAKVIGLYVAPPYEPAMYSDFVPADFLSARDYAASIRKAAARHLDFISKAAAAAGVSCVCTHVTKRSPHAEIVKAAKRYRCDLIFMASHGRSGIARLLLGSETSKVLAHTRIPVLVDR